MGRESGKGHGDSDAYDHYRLAGAKFLAKGGQGGRGKKGKGEEGEGTK